MIKQITQLPEIPEYSPADFEESAPGMLASKKENLINELTTRVFLVLKRKLIFRVGNKVKIKKRGQKANPVLVFNPALFGQPSAPPPPET